MLCNTLSKSRKYVKISMTFPMKTIKRQNFVNKVQLLHVNMEMNRIGAFLIPKIHAIRIFCLNQLLLFQAYDIKKLHTLILISGRYQAQVKDQK